MVNKKSFTSLILALTTLTLAACSTDSATTLYEASSSSSAQLTPIVERNSEEKSLNTVARASEVSESTEEVLNSESSEFENSEAEDTLSQSEVIEEDVVMSPDSIVNEDSISTSTRSVESDFSSDEDVETERSSENTEVSSEAEETIVSSEPLRLSSFMPSMASESSHAVTSESTFDNQLALNLMKEAAPLIHEASANAFMANEYSFTPIALDEHTVQVEVRRQSPDEQGHTNLITIYRYDTNDGHLMELNTVTNEWQDAF